MMNFKKKEKLKLQDCDVIKMWCEIDKRKTNNCK